MFQNIQISTYGSNGPLWSLAHEWWYYLLFPMALFVLKGSWQSRIVCLGGVALLAWCLTPYILILFGVWLLGVVAWCCNGKSWLPWWMSFPIFAVALVALCLAIELFPYAHQFFLGLGFACLLNSFSTSEWRFPFKSISRWLADFFYSLYLVHFPVVLFVIAVLFAKSGNSSRLQLNGQSISLFLIVSIIAFLASYIVSLFTEAKTVQIRSFLYALAGIQRTVRR